MLLFIFYAWKFDVKMLAIDDGVDFQYQEVNAKGFYLILN